ncbi:MAG: hypothetical protein R3264_23030, partial [Anaerolineae bacterium]|nr:hypothetical protein [Anaerolineae bacterium]
MVMMKTLKIIYQKIWCLFGLILLAVTMFFTQSIDSALAQSPQGAEAVELILVTEPKARVL